MPNNDILQNLPEIQIAEKELKQIENNQKDCVICLSNFVLGDKIKRLPCLHIFHTDCIEDWLHNSELCPLCKHNINE